MTELQILLQKLENIPAHLVVDVEAELTKCHEAIATLLNADKAKLKAEADKLLS
ncbi:MAG: hypothetical protein KGJ09_10705 [Candidatus Omnitrophica bacterium]|nr:hypothetical protein [Candidatus Omnitrophota bacterium]